MFYKYDISTKEYAGESQEAYYKLDGTLVEGYTSVSVPTFDDNTKNCKFIDGQWVVSDKPVDHIGVWEDINSNVQNINELGVTPPDGYATNEDNIWYFADGTEAIDITLKKKKEQKLSNLKNGFNTAQNGSIQSTVISKDINADSNALLNVQSLISYMNANSLTDTQFRCYDNTFVTVALSDLSNIQEELYRFRVDIHQKKWNIENQIDAATMDNIDSINWDSNLNIV